MTRDPRREKLGEFLKARRAELNPAAVGLPDGGQRRVAGLRREEVAMLAAISTDYYSRLEQGRMPASEPVLAALAQVFGLDDDQRAYLFGLAGKADDHQPHRPTRQQIQPQLQHMLDDLAHTPAFVIGRYTDVLAWNPMGAALITDFGKIHEQERTFIRLLVTDPAMRELYADWEEVTRLAIAQLRMVSASHPGDPRLAGLVRELAAQDAQFRQWWSEHDVATRGTGVKHLRHPVVGDLILTWNTLACALDPDQHIIVWTAEPGSPSHDGLRLLASWIADPSRSAQVRGSRPAVSDTTARG